MLPSSYASNQITFRVIGTCFSVQNKARKMGISARKILRRQSALRANFHESLLANTDWVNELKVSIYVVGEGLGAVYFATANPGSGLVAACGNSAKDAYKSLNSYLRAAETDKSAEGDAKQDTFWFTHASNRNLLKPVYPLTPSDILAPKHGRIVN